MQHATHTTTQGALTHDIEELDRLVHRIKIQLYAPMGKKSVLSHWRSIRGILKGKITEDPLSYQRRIRAESERL